MMMYSRCLPAIFFATIIFSMSVAVTKSCQQFDHLLTIADPLPMKKKLVQSYEALEKLVENRAIKAKDHEILIYALIDQERSEILVEYRARQALESFDEAFGYRSSKRFRHGIDHEHVVAMWEYATTAELILQHWQQTQKEPLSGYALSSELVRAIQDDIIAWTSDTENMAKEITNNIVNMKNYLKEISDSARSSKFIANFFKQLVGQTRPSSYISLMRDVAWKLVQESTFVNTLRTAPIMQDQDDDFFNDVIKNKKNVSRMIRIAARAAFLRNIAVNARELSKAGGGDDTSLTKALDLKNEIYDYGREFTTS